MNMQENLHDGWGIPTSSGGIEGEGTLGNIKHLQRIVQYCTHVEIRNSRDHN